MIAGQGKVLSSESVKNNKCSGCGHVKVCTVFRAVGPLLSQNWEEDSRPIDPDNLARICREFIDTESVRILTEAQ